MSESRKKKDSPEGPWTVSLVKDFLNARTWKFEKDPWPAWFAQRGGPERVLEFIRSCAIPTQLQDLLKEILQNPRFELTDENAPAVRTICAQLDGLPLALELAAGHCKYFSPQGLFERLCGSLGLLTSPTRDRPARHQTLQAAIAWSYDLLTPTEQTLFTRLAVFIGGWTAEAAAAVCNANGDLAPDVLAGLVALTDKSLLQQPLGANGEPRFRMLDTIHKYALQQLAARGELHVYQQLHAEHFLTLAECAEEKLISAESILWLNLLEQEHDNLRQVLRWALDEQRWDIALRLAGALREFWYARGHFREGRQWLARALQRAASVLIK